MGAADVKACRELLGLRLCNVRTGTRTGAVAAADRQLTAFLG